MNEVFLNDFGLWMIATHIHPVVGYLAEYHITEIFTLVSPTAIVKLNFFFCVCVCLCTCVSLFVHEYVCVCVHACMNMRVCVWRPTHNGLNWCNDGERERFPFLPTSWWLCMEVPGGRQFIMSPSPGLSLGEQAGTCVHELPPLPPSAGSQCVKPTSRGEKWLCYSISASYQ